MIQKKICMLGSFAVGKTSLVQRYVKGLFSGKYLTTVGVKIDKKQVTAQDRQVNLILWDLAGEDEFQRVQRSYLRGSSGYFLVVDGTRRETVETAMVLHERARQELGDVPFLLLINKTDLTDEWDMDEAQLQQLKDNGWRILYTSAKTGEQVEAAFGELASAMLDNARSPA
jgi:small GTP-binding protein